MKLLRALLCWMPLAIAVPAMAQSMPALRVDPSLLGGVAVERKEKAPEASKESADKPSSSREAQAPAARPEPAPVTKPVDMDTPKPMAKPEQAPASPAKPVAVEAAKKPAVEPAPAKTDTAAKPSGTDTAQAVKPSVAARPAAAEAAPVAPAAVVQPEARPLGPAKALPPPPEAAEAVAKPAAAATAARPANLPSAAPVQVAAAQPPVRINLEATRTAGGSSMPALRVNPALLAPPPPPPVQLAVAPAPVAVAPVSQSSATTAARTAAAPSTAAPVATANVRSGTPVAAAAPQLLQGTEPPQVMDRPVLPPLYSAYVAAGELPPPTLKQSAALAASARERDEPRPTFIAADAIRGRTDIETVAEGKVELRRIGTAINADRLSYWHLDDEVEALGNVRLERDRDVLSGPKMKLRVDESVGYFEQPTYSLTRSVRAKSLTPTADENLPLMSVTGHGQAERLDFEGENQFRLTKATYSTCGPASPDWYVEVGDLGLDYDREVGEGKEATLVFKGMPMLYSPWLSFSLNERRKSGLLTPTFGSTSKGGLELTVPWYWNIAPNMDATFAPRIMARRGTQYNTEFRYLDHRYGGQMRFEYLPDDRMANRRRSGYSIQHRHDLGYGLTGMLSLNGVSDDTYFSDLSTRLSVISQGNLLRQGTLAYSGGWWNASLNAQAYQTLKDPALPALTVPYKRLPQLNVTATRPDMPWGSTLAFTGEFVRFSHPTSTIGQRTTAYPQFSLPIQTSYFQFVPKVGLHVTRYAVERQGIGNPTDITRQVPIFSMDTGLVFERDTQLFGQALTQTLEPRLYYLYVPVRDQKNIPVFDSAQADFNFAQIFSENRYGGGDRIGDANQITAAAVSRLIDPDTGTELLRGLIGQRYYFTTQHVTLPAVGTTPAEVPRDSRKADVLAALSGKVAPKTWVDTGIQYNPRDSRTERLNFGGRYQPEIGKVLNAGYRYTRDQLGQVDVSGQWPLFGGWHGVGRYNYSTRERRVIETVGGLEYKADCWVARFVVQRLATQVQKSTTAFFIQLELNGLSRIGSNPLDVLKRNIPGYGLINQPAADPVFGTY